MHRPAVRNRGRGDQPVHLELALVADVHHAALVPEASHGRAGGERGVRRVGRELRQGSPERDPRVGAHHAEQARAIGPDREPRMRQVDRHAGSLTVPREQRHP